MKKYSKLLIAVLLVVEFCFMFLSVKSYMGRNVDEIQEVNEVDSKTFAMYIENDEGNYEEAIDTGVFPEGYILNLEMTNCIDNKGNNVDDILTSRDDKITVKSNKTVFCYLYFDKDNRVFAQVKRDYKNNNGALLLSETESDEYPVYYYSGDITNNNILYANFCWKMVRTTETGGVKLIYNGIPDEAEDRTLTCDNTGEESQIGTSVFNNNGPSPAYSGYMYNEEKIYAQTSKGYDLIKVFEGGWGNPTYYYGNTFEFDGTNYVLKNTDGSEVVKYSWNDNYENLIGQYSCGDGYTTTCPSLYYVAGGVAWYSYFQYLSGGKDYDDYKIKLAQSVTDNGDGTYTLVEPIEILKKDWYTAYANYNNYYVCNDLVSETCGEMHYSYSNTAYSYKGYNMAHVYKYGNSFKYENGIYTLVDTIEFWDWTSNYNALNNHHYTCFNTTGECDQIFYIFFGSGSDAIYITLNDGKSIEDALNEMLYDNDSNKTDSTIKSAIDEWYENNIVDILDSNNVLYSVYLENTIWCNNQNLSNSLGWNPNSSINTGQLWFSGGNSLNCQNKNDQYTLKVEAGGTEGYGNNALDYPIALLTAQEASMALGGVWDGGDGYLETGTEYSLMTPAYYAPAHRSVTMYYINSYGLSSTYAMGSRGIRPSVSLSEKVEIIGGDGSATTPYQVVLSSE